MTFAVIWRFSASQDVSRVEATAADPDRVRQAAARIDHMLRRYPRDMGESRVPGCRLWYEDVLGVYYRIDEEQLRVEILFAGPARRR
jgi:hypothetical protein